MRESRPYDPASDPACVASRFVPTTCPACGRPAGRTNDAFLDGAVHCRECRRMFLADGTPMVATVMADGTRVWGRRPAR